MKLTVLRVSVKRSYLQNKQTHNKQTNKTKIVDSAWWGTMSIPQGCHWLPYAHVQPCACICAHLYTHWHTNTHSPSQSLALKHIPTPQCICLCSLCLCGQLPRNRSLLGSVGLGIRLRAELLFLFFFNSLFGGLPSLCMPIQDHREANRSPRDLQHNAYIKSVSIPVVNVSHMTKPKSRDSVAGCPS